MDDYQKYLKYKTKYLILKEIYKTKHDGGGKCKKKNFLLFNNNVCELTLQEYCKYADIG
jgi:hypothetical protein